MKSCCSESADFWTLFRTIVIPLFLISPLKRNDARILSGKRTTAANIHTDACGLLVNTFVEHRSQARS